MTVILTSGYATPPVDTIIECDQVVRNEKTHKIGMYKLTKKGKSVLYRFAIYEDWERIVIVYDDGREELVYESGRTTQKTI